MKTRKYHNELPKRKTVNLGNRIHNFELGSMKELSDDLPAKSICPLCPKRENCVDYHMSRRIGFIIASCDIRKLLSKIMKVEVAAREVR